MLGAAALAPACTGVNQRQWSGGYFKPRHLVDLTHTLHPDFPYIPVPGITFPFAMEPIATLTDDGVAANAWRIHEHMGTQIDAPNHFIEGGRALHEIRDDELIAPLAIIDISDRAASDADAVVTIEDIRAWERRHGAIPDGACVMMRSGWDAFIDDATRFIGLDEAQVKHFPGISNEAAAWLISERSVWGVGVDTISFDPGYDGTYQTHRTVLGADKLAVEGVANLARLPPRGATMIVGAAKVRGATGGIARLIAVW